MWIICNSHATHNCLTSNVNTTDFQVSVAQPSKCCRRLARPSLLLFIGYPLQTNSPSVDRVGRRRQSTSHCVFDKTRGWRRRLRHVSHHCEHNVWIHQTQKTPLSWGHVITEGFLEGTHLETVHHFHIPLQTCLEQTRHKQVLRVDQWGISLNEKVVSQVLALPLIYTHSYHFNLAYTTIK